MQAVKGHIDELRAEAGASDDDNQDDTEPGYSQVDQAM
jgi:hypothetical protein